MNQGFALVQSETADIFALRLAHNNALVAYRMLPNPDIPKDWNIISFPLNPRVEITAGGFGLGFGFEASSSASLNQTRATGAQAAHSFSIDTSVSVTGNLQRYDENLVPQFDSDGNAISVPGKVDAYRFVTFYLDSNKENFEDFYNKVVDPIWLAQSDHPNAAALRATQQSDKKPPCWRIFHRVTFVSRLLPPVAYPSEFPLEAAMREQDISSSYELVRQIDPYLKNRTASLRELSVALRCAFREWRGLPFGLPLCLVEFGQQLGDASFKCCDCDVIPTT